MTGKIKKINEKGFGFIEADGLQKDLFFHKSSLVGVAIEDLKGGEAVTFEMAESPKGPNATNVQLVVA